MLKHLIHNVADDEGPMSSNVVRSDRRPQYACSDTGRRRMYRTI